MLEKNFPKDVTLKGDRKVVIRPLQEGDFDRLYAFFTQLAEDDRSYLRDNVCDPELVRKWTNERNFDAVIPLVVLDGDEIVADGTLHIDDHGWMRHVGTLRLVVAESHRQAGLGTVLARELVALAEHRGIEKLQTTVAGIDQPSIKMYSRLGFETVAELKDLVVDSKGKKHDLVIMINEVESLGRIMEDWILDSMIPSYRAPGGGY